MPHPPGTVGTIVALVALCALLSTCVAAYLAVARWLARGAALRERVLIAIVLVLTVQYVGGLGLLAVGAFGSSAFWLLAAVGTALAAMLLRDAEGRRSLLRDGRRAVAAGRLLVRRSGGARGRAGLALAVTVVALQAVRGAILPPLDWDFLSYHGPRAAFWVQEGRLDVSFDAAGVWQVYRALPVAGDLLTAWAMAGARGDALVPVVWAGIWMGLVLAVYAAARAVGARRRPAVLAAAFVGLLPAAFQHMTSGYVDNAVALAVLAGAALLAAGWTRREAAPLVWGLLGFAVALTVKPTGLPFFATAGVVCVVGLRRLGTPGERARALAGFALVVGVASLWPLKSWAEHGNPFYPVELRVAGFELPGNAADPTEVGVVALGHPGPVAGLTALFVSGFRGEPILHNGFTLAGLAVLGLGLVALARRPRPVAPLLALAATGYLLLAIFPGRMSDPGLDDARYILAVPALAAVALARVRSRWASVVLGLGLVLPFIYDLPLWRWGGADSWAVPLCLAAGALAALGAHVGRRSRVAVLLAGLVVALASAVALRPWVAEPDYRAAARGELLASGPIDFSPNAASFPAWEALRDAPALRIAVTAGPSPLRTHWFLYPLLGRRLQHTLVYVRAPGTSMAARTADPRGLDAEARRWAAELERARVDTVMIYDPPPRERLWVAHLPERFVPLAADAWGVPRLYRVAAPP